MAETRLPDLEPLQCPAGKAEGSTKTLKPEHPEPPKDLIPKPEDSLIMSI